MARLGLGKVPNDVLRTVVFANLGREDRAVILGPNVGEDAALLRLGDRILAFKSDPITGSADELGFLAVYVNANDIATRGAVPRWFTQCILLPEGYPIPALQEICRQIDSAAKEVGVSIVGGHTEVTKWICRPIVVGSMIGIVKSDRFFTSSGAQVGDTLYMTKSAGLEGTAILSSDPRIVKRFGRDFTSRCKSMLKLINVVEECLVLASLEGVTAMHDVTEGGILGGIWELAEAASSGVSVDLASVRVIDETRDLCRELALDPYRLIGSGSVIFTVRPGDEATVEGKLASSGVVFSRIGRVTEARRGRVCSDLDGRVQEILPPSADELWKGLA